MKGRDHIGFVNALGVIRAGSSGDLGAGSAADKRGCSSGSDWASTGRLRGSLPHGEGHRKTITRTESHKLGLQ